MRVELLNRGGGPLTMHAQGRPRRDHSEEVRHRQIADHPSAVRDGIEINRVNDLIPAGATLIDDRDIKDEAICDETALNAGRDASVRLIA
jgi:hypothetical protein